MGLILYISYPELYSKLQKDILNTKQQEIIDYVFDKITYPKIQLLKTDELIRTYNKDSLKYLLNRINAIYKSDIIYFADGWEKDKVCCIEYNIAIKYNKKIIYRKNITNPIGG